MELCMREILGRESFGGKRVQKTYINRDFHVFDVATGFEMSSNVSH